jgi:hypothetical protein
MSVAYINYHRKPRVQFLSIKQYNETFGTTIEENEQFEHAFKSAWTSAKRQTDPNEYIQHNFSTSNVGFVGDMIANGLAGVADKVQGKVLRKYSNNGKKLYNINSRAAKTVGAGLNEVKEGVKRGVGNVKEKYDELRIEKEEKEEKKTEEEVQFLDDYAEQNEVSEAPAVHESPVEDVSDDYVSLSDQIDSLLADTAKDSQCFSRDRTHVIHFNTMSEDLSSRLMKGRDRYLKRLQQYVDGDTSVKVRMLNNKEVLVSSLKPNIASLKSLLQTASGEPRYCICDC